MWNDSNHSLRNKIMSGLVWSYGERIIAQLVSFAVSIILARLIDPASFGVLSLVTVFITISNTLTTSGFGNALVQKKDADQKDFSSVFWASLVVSLFIYLILWISAPFISGYYENDNLIWIIRVMSLRLPVSAINSVQYAYIQKRMEFKKFFFSTLGGIIVSAVVGIYMAYNGFGVWALVAQYLINTTINTVVLFITSKWVPSRECSKDKLKPLLSFGWKIMLTGLISESANEIRTLVIGKKFTMTDLAFYERGQRFPQLIIGNISVILAKVSFPAFSSINDDLIRLKALMRRSMQLSMFMLAPMMIGMATVAEPLIHVLMTDKWIGAVPFVQILTIYYLFYPVMSTASQVIKAQGRGDEYLGLGIVRCSIEIILLFVSVFVFNSVVLIAVSAVISIVVSTVICMILNQKRINYLFKEQISDMIVPLIFAFIMGIAVFMIGKITIFPMLLTLILQIISGLAIYVLLNYFTRNQVFLYVLHLVKVLYGKLRRN